MAREVYVTLGGAERLLHFTTHDAITLQRRFGKKPKQLLREDIAPSEIVDRDGEVKRILSGEFSPEVVCAALYLGIVRAMPSRERRGISESDVIDWFDEGCRTVGAGVFINKLCDAILLDGITGVSVDSDAARRAKEESEGESPAGDEGKAVRPPENP